MSARIGAWADLVNWDGSDAYLELCSAAMLEVQREARRKALREAADAISESEYLRDHTDAHMGDIYAAASVLRRMADELKKESSSDPLV